MYGVIIVVALTGNCFIGAIVFKTKSMRRAVNYLIVNMAMSEFLLPIFAFPCIPTGLCAGYWLIDGPLFASCFYCRLDPRYLLLFVVEILVVHVVLLVLFILGHPGAVGRVGINGGESFQHSRTGGRQRLGWYS